MIFQEQTPDESQAGIERLLLECWQEIGHWGIEKPNPNYDTYRRLHSVGMLHIIGAVQDGEMVGYATIFVTDLMQHKGVTGAFVDSVFMNKSHRIIAGYRMLKFVEQTAKKYGAMRMNWDVTIHNDFGRTLTRMGYELESTRYSGGL
jgi:GNAT superfamily N-acetyltransferase